MYMAEINLGENERVDDLQCKGRLLIQNSKMFCFGMDAVLLANYAVINDGDVCMDFCTGNGIVPILLEAKNNAGRYIGIEILKESAELAARSVALNRTEDKITIVNDDLKNAPALYKGGAFDVVTVNPPYMSGNGGLKNNASAKAIARHEICCTLDDIAASASGILKDKGRFYMVHRPQRLAQIFEICRRHRLEPKRMRLVYPSYGKEANMVLLEAVRGGGTQLTVEPPLIVYDENGGYTRDLLEFYGDVTDEQ